MTNDALQDATKLKWQTRHRLMFLESVLVWEGKFSRSRMKETFNASSTQTSTDINEYLSLAKDNMIYSYNEKRYFPTKKFTPIFHDKSFSQYLSLSGHQKDSRVEYVDNHRRTLCHDSVRPVLHAMWENKGIQIRYATMAAGIDKSFRIIWPTQLVDTGFRWHIRALTQKDDGLVYRDFVLSRIIESAEFVGPATPVPDIDWNTMIDVVLEPNPSDAPDQATIIAQEYSMKEGELTLKVRKALLIYTLQRFQIDYNEMKPNPKKQQLRIKNIEDVLPHLPGY